MALDHRVVRHQLDRRAGDGVQRAGDDVLGKCGYGLGGLDRLLVAQAQAERLTIVTADRRIAAHDVAVVDAG